MKIIEDTVAKFVMALKDAKTKSCKIMLLGTGKLIVATIRSKSVLASAAGPFNTADRDTVAYRLHENNFDVTVMEPV